MIGAVAGGVEATVPFPGETLTDGNGTLPARLALVIGVAEYDSADHVSVPNLPGVARDMQRMVAALRDADFNITQPDTNGLRVTRNDIIDSLNRFSLKVRQLRAETGKKPVALVYFAGHGVNNGADNLLIPSDFNPTFQEDLPDMAIPLATIRQRLAALDVSARYIILDACRSQISLSLASLAGSGPKAYKPGVTDMQIDTADESIWFATLSGGVASDTNTFTRSLIDVLDKQRALALREAKDPRFSDEAPPPQPVANTYGDTNRVLVLVATDMRRFGQLPDHAGNSLPLTLYPTKANYRTERKLYEQFAAAKSVSQFERRYCLGESYMETFSLYSYFSSAISTWNRNFEETLVNGERPACADLIANATAGAPEAGAATLEGLVSTAALSDTARQAIGGFSGETPLRTLAVAGADLPIYRFANAGGATLATLDRGELVAVGDTNGAFIRVRTPDGTEGYAEQKLVNAGTSLLRVTLAYDDNGELTGTSQSALKALADTVVYDVAVEYRDSDNKGGLLLAVSAFDELKNATFIPEEVVPLYRPADAAGALPPRSVRVLLTALPLDPALRSGAYSYSGGKVSLDAALTLSQPVLASAAANATLGQGSAIACASPLSPEATAGKVAIIRYPSASEAGAAETVRRVFGTVGFATPDPIQKGTRIVRQGTRVTYCATDQPLIDQAKARLSACFGDAFRYFPTSDRALCASGRIDVVVTDASLTTN